jgi:hypothetical protein
LKRRSSPCIFQVVAFLSIQSFLIIATTYTGTDLSRLLKLSPIGRMIEVRAPDNI